MQKDIINLSEDLTPKETARLILDLYHRMILHHGIWYTEVRHQLGREKALELLKTEWQKSFDIQLKRIGKIFGFDLIDGIPAPLLDLPKETLHELLKAISLNWLANDGVWFQAVEFSEGMTDAKRCNDSCWAQFSPIEASFIKNLLDLPDNSGLEGLKKALQYRLYATINTQSIVDEGPNSFVFQMNECRVQSARKRKGLEDYPCKSAGVVEYPYFARTIDKRIVTECVGCPPDPHPDEWFCAWRFKILDEQTP